MSTPREVIEIHAAAPAAGEPGRLRRVLDPGGDPDGNRRGLDPFLLLAEFGSARPDDYIGGFPDHPHRGFETVTYVLAGRMLHRDSAGHRGALGPGDVQWMTAGRGIVHSEMPDRSVRAPWGFQLWVNLPAAHKMAAPRYQEIGAADIPRVARDGASVKVIAGDFESVTGSVRGIVTRPTYLDVGLEPAARLDWALGGDQTVLVYGYEGSIRIGAARAPIEPGRMARLGPGEDVRLEGGDEGGRALLLAAAPLGEPVVQYGPFVMNTAAEIEDAIADYRSGRFMR